MNTQFQKFNDIFNQNDFTFYKLKNFCKSEIDFKLLSKHQDIHYSWISEKSNENWDCCELSQHIYLSIPIEFINKNLNSNWDFQALSKNDYFDFKWLELFTNAGIFSEISKC